MLKSHGIIKLVTAPTIIPWAEPCIIPGAPEAMREWLQQYRPECVPEQTSDMQPFAGLFPHDGREKDEIAGTTRDLTHAELTAEAAGRGCYQSWGLKAGRKSNKDYLEHTQGGTIPHRSIMYHPKFTFFVAGISRRVSHELIRNYVGADRSEEGSPSQESTRYTYHPGHYVLHPGVVGAGEGEEEEKIFAAAMEHSYDEYRAYINRRENAYIRQHDEKPKGLDRKRIYESASSYLHHSVATSFFWTTNPIALAKLVLERENEAADLEFARLARKWRLLAIDLWPNLFPQPWMKHGPDYALKNI